MSSYMGRHAELYDVFYADKPYAEEAEFVDRLLRRHGRAEPQRLLELACGTGRHAVQFAKRGWEVLALDYSKDMIARAERRVADRQLPIELRCADMRDPDLADAQFDAAVCLFDSIGYAQTNEGVAQVLDVVHRHLAPGGTFALEFWHAGAMLREYDPLRVRRWEAPDCELIRISETKLDCARQLGHVTYTILELNDDGQYDQLQETQTNRFFLVQEMSALLAHAGLSPVAFHAGFSDEQQVTERTWHVVAVARREEGA